MRSDAHRASRNGKLAKKPNNLELHIKRFVLYCEVKGLSPQTAETYKQRLKEFAAWCSERELRQPKHITRKLLERYQRHLFHRIAINGPNKGFRLSKKTQHNCLMAVKSLFRYLVRDGVLSSNPAADLELPSIKEKLPRDVLNVLEVEAVLSQPNLSTPQGQRDRAILEMLYATGIRRQELAGLSVYDVDFSRGTLHVRFGKGDKERMVPTGERALVYLEKYLVEARNLMAASSEQALFVSSRGCALSKITLSATVSRYIKMADLNKKGSCHLFRHTMATLMLEGGADLRYIQAMLGHSDPSSTEIYTHVSIGALKKVHQNTHPGAKFPKKQFVESQD